jgi:CO/xanthine dehydrogenase FAD-binding subunit
MPTYARPLCLPEALTALAGGARVLAGGTDLYPGAGLLGDVLDITAIPDLQGIACDTGLRIGGATTWSQIAEADLPPACAALQQAARAVGGRQIQNAGTVAGNLCNASPAADGLPPLLVLGAEVELASVRGVRRLALADFVLGPRKTALLPDEILVAVHLPQTALAGRSMFSKLGARAFLVISIASVAVRLVVSGGAVTQAAVAVGACSAVAQRLPLVEAALIGLSVNKLDGAVHPDDLATLRPIDDLRATAGYRLDAACALVRRAVMECGGMA